MGAKLLIIDDEPDLCGLFQKVFQQEGHMVLTATAGQEGIAKAKKGQPDIIFLDLVMPGMNGIAAIKKIRRVAKNSKIVVLTGHGSVKTAQEAMKQGAYDYTSKPFDLGLIRQFIQEVSKGGQ